MEELVAIARELSAELGALRFGPPVSHVYDPLVYARAPFERWTRAYAGTGRVVLVGMNPGPFGMAQTGVPFGEVTAVRDWMGIDEPVDKPVPEHPKRPVLGFAQPRSEVSGARLWGWARERFGTAEEFFRRFFVVNWCPLCFLEASGRNLTPDHLAAADRAPLFAACDRALGRQLAALAPRVVVGVGGFAESRARRVTEVAVGRILHPSPASPAANRGWAEQVDRELARLGVPVGAGPEVTAPRPA